MLISPGAKVVLCVSDNHASKLAYKMAKAVLRPNDTLLLLTVVMTEDSLDYGHQLLEQYAEQAPLNPIERVVRPAVQPAAECIALSFSHTYMQAHPGMSPCKLH